MNGSLPMYYGRSLLITYLLTVKKKYPIKFPLFYGKKEFALYGPLQFKEEELRKAFYLGFDTVVK
jgi:hypothetical protein